MADFAVPTLPMRNSAETRMFYEKLGFICAHENEAPFIDGTIRDHTCYIYTDDLERMYRAFDLAGVGKLMPIELKPWGVPEFVLVDINGNTLRVGCPRLMS